MPAFENTGLRVVELPDVGALGADVDGPADERPHAVRVDVTDGDWPGSREGGVVVRPAWVHWVSPAGGGVQDVIARQSHGQRQRTRGALRALGTLTMEVHDPIEPAPFEEWLALYGGQVDAMRYGRNLAAIFRKMLLAPDSRHGLVTWRRNGRLVCGTVVLFDAERDGLVARYNAVAAEHKGAELPRGMCVSIADLAAARGMRWVTLGSDVNFYGALVRPGLCAFKLRLGFRPVPGDLFGRAARDVAERVTSLRGLEQPVLRFEHRLPRDPRATVADYAEGPYALGLVSVTAAGGSSVVLDSLPEHRRLVLPP
ncbi:MAG: hypothetical protein ACJ74O_10910 [Frankiaceae bacterium]